MLAVEYDVAEDGLIHVVAVIEAVDEEGVDLEGEAWIRWRRAHSDEGHGCVVLSPTEFKLIGDTEDEDELRRITEMAILRDRQGNEVRG